MDVLGVELIDAAEKARADATRRETYYGLKDGKGDVPRRDRVKALHLASNAAHAILELRATSGYEVDTLLKGDELEDLVQALYDCRGRSKTKEFDGAIRSATAALALSVTTRDTRVDPKYVVDALKRMEISAKDPAAMLASAHVVLNASRTFGEHAANALLRRKPFSKICGFFAADATPPTVLAVLARALANLADLAHREAPAETAAPRAISFERLGVHRGPSVASSHSGVDTLPTASLSNDGDESAPDALLAPELRRQIERVFDAQWFGSGDARRAFKMAAGGNAQHWGAWHAKTLAPAVLGAATCWWRRAGSCAASRTAATSTRSGPSRTGACSRSAWTWRRTPASGAARGRRRAACSSAPETTGGTPRPAKTSNLSISVTSKSFRLIFGRIVFSRRVLARQRNTYVGTPEY